MKLRIKLRKLRDIILSCKRVLIAFSGGVDSTFLLAFSRILLGKENVLAVTALSDTYSKNEKKLVEKLINKLDVNHIFIQTDESKDLNFLKNTRKRCFYCKNELFRKLKALAVKNNLVLCEGANFSDLEDFRPGKLAAKKWGVKAPLLEVRMKKEEIRKLSKILRLPTWDLPAQACLASRIPYGTRISPEILKKIESGENILKDFGFKTVRLRHHGDIARIEVEKNQLKGLFACGTADKITAALKKMGWKYITFDMEGYRTGSLN